MQRLKISREGIILIKSFEGFRPHAVRREDGRWVIGYGHTLSAREGGIVGEQDAELLLQYDLLPVAKTLNAVAPPLNQHQFDALASFAFSVGLEKFEASDVLARLNAGSTGEAADAIVGWIEPAPTVTPLRRRAAERALFVADPAWPVALADLLSAPLPPPPIVVPEFAPPSLPEVSDLKGVDTIEIELSGPEDYTPQDVEPVAVPPEEAPHQPFEEVHLEAIDKTGFLNSEDVAPLFSTPIAADEDVSATPTIEADLADLSAPETVSEAASESSFEPVVHVRTDPATEAQSEPVPDPASDPEPGSEPGLDIGGSVDEAGDAVIALDPMDLGQSETAPTLSKPPVIDTSRFEQTQQPSDDFLAGMDAPLAETRIQIAPPPVIPSLDRYSAYSAIVVGPLPGPVAGHVPSAVIPTPVAEPARPEVPPEGAPAVSLTAVDNVETTTQLTEPPLFQPSISAGSAADDGGELLVLTPLDETSVFPSQRLVWPHDEPVQTDAPLFEDDGALRLGAHQLIRHEVMSEPPLRIEWRETGLYLVMGAFGLLSFGMSMAAFRKASQASSGADDITIIAAVLAVIGTACVGVSAYNLYRRLGRVDD